jgi:TonB family protein
VNKVVSERVVRRYLSSIFWLALFCAVLLAATPAPVRAQQAEIDALAARAAQKIAKAHGQAVVVVDFATPQAYRTELGRWLAQQFSSALAKTNPTLRFIDGAGLGTILEAERFLAIDLVFREIAARAGQRAGADMVVTGALVPAKEGFKLVVGIFATSKEIKHLSDLSERITLTPAMKELNDKPLGGVIGNVLIAGKGGVGYPTCISCPNPDFTPAARQAKRTGIVLLHLTITPEGRAADIVLFKTLGYGLDENAIEAVRKWVFKPALDRDGKPVAVRVTIEVSFRWF